MSGHSKWHSIRHKKGAADAKRGKIFSKLSKAITVTVKEGGPDPSMNFSLRLAIEKAKQANMPKDNIERAIARGSGAGGGDQLTTAVYEGMGPGGVSLIIEAVTDNTNRTIGSLKTIFNKLGGNLDAKVLWQFEQKAVVRIEDTLSIADRDAFELALIDAGAEDIRWEDGYVEIIGARDTFQDLEKSVTKLSLTTSDAGLEYVAKDLLSLSEEDEEKLANLLEALDEDDDVNHVFTNAE